MFPKRRLGQYGLEVSALGLGCMALSWSYGVLEDKASVRLLFRAVEEGVTFWDTADAYGFGHNEKLLAQVLKSKREQICIASKGGLLAQSGKLEVNGRPKYLRQACEESLLRLGIDTLDLYYLHRLDPQVPIEESVGELRVLMEEGKILHLGLAEVSEESLRRAVTEAPISVVQAEYSLWTREIEKTILPCLQELKVGLVASSPLARGFLSAEIRDSGDLAEQDFRRKLPRFSDENIIRNGKLAQRLKVVARERGAEAAHYALAWLLRQPAGVVPIFGTTNIDHLLANIEALQVEFAPGELEVLEAQAEAVAGASHFRAPQKA